jgi:predicted transcriptional regulator
MPGKKVPYTVRYPDFGIPYRVIAYGSYAQIIMYYAQFKKSSFTYADHMGLRGTAINKYVWTNAVKKLVELGWITNANEGEYAITESGSKAVRFIGSRNALRRLTGEEPKDV